MLILMRYFVFTRPALWYAFACVNPFAPRVSYGDIKVILNESVDEIPWCDPSNETSSAVLSHGTIYIQVFYQMKFGDLSEF